jgi:hypothetical protein
MVFAPGAHQGVVWCLRLVAHQGSSKPANPKALPCCSRCPCSKFAVPEARWYWLKLGALAAAHDWEGLDAWAGERRSPIGWEPFLAAAQKHGAPREVQARWVGCCVRTLCTSNAVYLMAVAIAHCPGVNTAVTERCRPGGCEAVND